MNTQEYAPRFGGHRVIEPDTEPEEPRQSDEPEAETTEEE